MTTPLAAKRVVHLGGAERELKYTPRAFIVLGVNMMNAKQVQDIFNQIATDPQLPTKLILAGLVHSDKQLTFDKVLDWLDACDNTAEVILEACQALSDSLTQYYKQVEASFGNGDQPANPQNAQIG